MACKHTWYIMLQLCSFICSKFLTLTVISMHLCQDRSVKSAQEEPKLPHHTQLCPQGRQLLPFPCAIIKLSSICSVKHSMRCSIAAFKFLLFVSNNSNSPGHRATSPAYSARAHCWIPSPMPTPKPKPMPPLRAHWSPQPVPPPR